MLTKTRETILAEMKMDPYVTEKILMEKTGIGKTAVYNNIGWLKERGYIQREGSRNGGRWIVLDSEALFTDGGGRHNGTAPAALMPLTNMEFEPGDIRSAIRTINDPDVRAIAEAEYYYYSGQAERCSDAAQKYLDSEDPALRLTAQWFFTYSNLTLNRTDISSKVLGDIKKEVREKMSGSR